MRSRLYTATKGKIVSARFSDDEMENIKKLMQVTNKSASEIMRIAFQLQIDRFQGAGATVMSSGETSQVKH
jgi:Ribbon-helix-helix protein, copG family